MYKLNYSEFYITNVCNLNCDNCNRFNNFAFTGHHRWQDHVDDYVKWSKIIDFNEIAILGGEPMVNPDFMSWLNGVPKLWPNSNLSIVTNGTQLKRWPELYQTLVDLNGRCQIEISQHNQDTMSSIIQDVREFLTGPVIETKGLKPNNEVDLWLDVYNKKIKDPSWPTLTELIGWDQLPDHIKDECINVQNFDPEVWFGPDWRDLNENYYLQFVDVNNVTVRLHPSWRFRESAVKLDLATKTLSVHDSDPDTALALCNFKECHHFIAGKLYKCGPVGILPEFVKQFQVNVTEQQSALINSYQPAEHTWGQTQLEGFLDNLSNAKVIPQCALCPESLAPKKFAATTKKIKIHKNTFQKL